MVLRRTISPAVDLPVTEEDLVRRAYDGAPSRERLETLIKKQNRLSAEIEVKAIEHAQVEGRLLGMQSGKRYSDGSQRLIDTPLDEPLFPPDAAQIGLMEQLQKIDRESAALRLALRDIKTEIDAARAEVSREVANTLRPRQNEIVGAALAAGRAFIEAMLSEKRLHSALGPLGVGDALPTTVFYGLLTCEDDFSAFKRWQDSLLRDGFQV